MRAIAGMARSYKGHPQLAVTAGASLLANRIPQKYRRWEVREQARSYEEPCTQPTASIPPAASRPASSRMNNPSSSDWLPMPSLA